MKNFFQKEKYKATNLKVISAFLSE